MSAVCWVCKHSLDRGSRIRGVGIPDTRSQIPKSWGVGPRKPADVAVTQPQIEPMTSNSRFLVHPLRSHNCTGCVTGEIRDLMCEKLLVFFSVTSGTSAAFVSEIVKTLTQHKTVKKDFFSKIKQTCQFIFQ